MCWFLVAEPSWQEGDSLRWDTEANLWRERQSRISGDFKTLVPALCEDCLTITSLVWKLLIWLWLISFEWSYVVNVVNIFQRFSFLFLNMVWLMKKCFGISLFYWMNENLQFSWHIPVVKERKKKDLNP